MTRAVFLVIAVLAATSLPLFAQTADQPPLECVVVDEPPAIDGELDDGCWQTVPRVTDFYDHNTGAAASEKTEAWICCDSRFIYAAFRCYDSQPDKIKAEQKSRGGAIDTDDWVGLYIDPFHDRNTMVQFQVTPRGVQVESLQSSQGGKIEWIGDWTAAAKMLPDAYSVEMRIPWSVLKYGKNQSSMGVAFQRQHARTGQGWTSPNIGPNQEVSRYYNWRGLTPPEYKPRPLILGYSLAGSGDGIDRRFTSGLDIKQAIGTGLTGVLTLNPDFRNVEQAVGSISFSYNEKYLPDSRPFFLEGASYFPSSTMFYSRRIGAVDAGAKLVGKQGNYSYAFLNAREFNQTDNFVGQIGRQYGEDGGYWLAMTHTNQPDLNNNAYQTSLWRRLYKNGDHQLKASTAFYRSAGGLDRTGNRTQFGLDSSAPNGQLQWNVYYYDIDPDFRPALGIEEETDKKGFSGWFAVNRRPTRGKTRETEVGMYWDLLDHQDGSIFRNQIGGYVIGELQNGLSGTVRWYNAKQPPFLDKIFNVGIGWNGNDMYQSGETQYSMGDLAGGPHSYFAFSQTFKVGENLVMQAWYERDHIGDPSPYSGTHRQFVTSLTYDFDTTQGISARIVDYDGQSNLSTAFRRRVSAGMDAYVIYGDPNAEETRDSVIVKLVRPL